MHQYSHTVALTAATITAAGTLATVYKHLPPNGQALVEWFAAFALLVVASVGLLSLPAALRARQHQPTPKGDR